MITNTHPDPTAAISTPATAGPIMRAALNDVEFNPTAFERSCSPTSSATNVWRAAESNALTHPSRNANRYTCHKRANPDRVRIPKPSARSPIVACVAISTLRRSKVSAANPDNGSISACGPNCSAITMPSAVALLWVSSASTSQSCAVRCIQVPTLDTSAPAAQTR